MTDWRVFACDKNRVTTGRIDTWSKLDLTLRHCNSGVWSLTMPGAHPQADLLTEGSRIVVHKWAGGPVTSGPVRRIARAGSDGSPNPLVTVSGIDDNAQLAMPVIYPDPANTAPNQTLAYDVRNAAAETVIRGVIDDNAGSSALAARRIAGLTLTADAASGSTVKMSARFSNLLEECAALAESGGIGFKVLQNGTDLELSFYTITDLSDEIVLSTDLGNLRAWSWSLAAPTSTRALVAGGGTGAARVIVERSATTPETDWNMRAEAFIDARDTSDTATLNQRGDEYLATAAATAGLSISPVDTPNRVFGVDYNLGDKVTVEVPGGGRYCDTITEVRIQVDGNGQQVKPTVGDASLTGETSALYARVRALTRRLGLLERRV